MTVRLEIHHIAIAGGDATAILLKDTGNSKITRKVLIDAGGELASNSFDPLASYLSKFMDIKEPFDLIVTSHYHSDHFAGFAECNIPCRHFMDYGGYFVGNDKFTPFNPLPTDRNAITTFEKYAAYIEAQVKSPTRGSVRIPIPFIDEKNYINGELEPDKAGPVSIKLSENPDPEITLRCYAANGILADGTNALRESTRNRMKQMERTDDDEPMVDEDKVNKQLRNVSPNDQSLALILEWGSFCYLTTGDLSGDLSLTRYRNIEEPLIEYLRKQPTNPLGKVSVLKATHHGSNWNNYPSSDTVYVDYKEGDAENEEQPDELLSGKVKKEFKSINNRGYLDELNPVSIIVPCNQVKHVPGGKFLTRTLEFGKTANQNLDNPDKHRSIFFVNKCEFDKKNSTKQKAEFANVTPLVDANDKKLALINLYYTSQDRKKVTNQEPVSIIVYVPKLGADEQLGFKQNITINRHDHSIVLVFDPIESTTSRQAFDTVPPSIKLPSLDQASYVAVFDTITEWGEIVENYSPEQISDKAIIQEVDTKLPIFTDYISGNPVINEEKRKKPKQVLRDLYKKVYVPKANRKVSPKDIKLSRNELITLKSIMTATKVPTSRKDVNVFDNKTTVSRKSSTPDPEPLLGPPDRKRRKTTDNPE